MRVYVASSWKNQYQPEVVRALRQDGHEVYDFRNPMPNNHGFHWSEIDPAYRSWAREQYVDALNHPLAQGSFNLDFGAMEWAELGVMVIPCGSSAHLEAGYFAGAKKPLIIYLPEMIPSPELTYKMARAITVDIPELLYEVRTQQALMVRAGTL